MAHTTGVPVATPVFFVGGSLTYLTLICFLYGPSFFCAYNVVFIFNILQIQKIPT